MRSRFHVLSGQHPSDLSRILDRAESLASELPAGKILDAIGRTARLDAVLRARYSALLAPTPPVQAQSDPEAARYLDAVRTAAYLGVSKSTVVRLTKAGAIPCIRPSPPTEGALPAKGAVRYDRQALDAFMEGRKKGHLPL